MSTWYQRWKIWYSHPQLHRVQHTLAACVHLASATTILLYGLSETSWDIGAYDVNIMEGGNRTVWKYSCYNRTSGTYMSAGNETLALQCNNKACRESAAWAIIKKCPTANRAFYAPGLRGPNSERVFVFNILAAAFTFAAWSGVWHLAVLAAGKAPCAATACSTLFPSTFAGVQRTARWCDYAVSAPVMLAVVGAAFSAPNTDAVVVAPVAMAAIIVAAAIIDPASSPYPLTQTSRIVRAAVLLGLIAAYGVAWTPISSAVDRSSRAPAPGTANAPDFVETMMYIVIAVFSLFPVVYVYDFIALWPRASPGRHAKQQPYMLAYVAGKRTYNNVVVLGKSKRPASRAAENASEASEGAYIALSMAAKVLLHAFLGIAVIQQTRMLGNTVPTTQPTSAEDEGAQIRNATIGVFVGALVLNFGVAPVLANKRGA